MYLSNNNNNASDAASPLMPGMEPARPALTAELIENLLASSETPREVLLAALQESRRQFESLLSCVSGTFYRCELNPPWKMEFISAGIETITGFDTDFFNETPYGDIIDPEDRPALEQAVEEAVARRKHFSAFYRLKHKSGGQRWVREHGKAVYDENGTPLFLEGFISDVTKTRRLETEAEISRAEIEKLNRRMSVILDGTNDEIFSVDRELNYLFANKAFLAATSMDETLIGKNLQTIFPHCRETPLWPVAQRVLETGEPGVVEIFHEGQKRWFQSHIIPSDEGLASFLRDITAQKALESALVEQADTLRNTLDLIPAMVWTAPPDGRVEYFSTHWNQFLGPSVENFQINLNVMQDRLCHPDDWDAVWTRWQHSVETGEAYEQEFRVRLHSGEYRWVLSRAWPQKDEYGNVVHWYGVNTDIHERVLAENNLKESQKLQENILHATTDSIQVLDRAGLMIEVNTATLLATGLSDPEALLGRSWLALWPRESRSQAQQAIETAREGQISRFSGYGPTANGDVRWWDVIMTPIRNPDGAISNLLSIARDITEQRATAENLRIASEQDPLTRLPNRRVFEDYLREMTNTAAQTGASIGLMLLDLDYFKHVNDTLGHMAGDHLLHAIAQRLKACTAENGFVARLGGDEFAVVLNDIAADSELRETANRILSSIEIPVFYAGKAINGSVSIGCAVYPRDATDAQELFKLADTALYDLKTGGRGGVQMFDGKMMEAAKRMANQLTLARQALHEDAVQPFYQPKVCLETGEVAGFEALLRWWCPSSGIQPPSTVAEAFCDYELSTKIGSLMQTRVLEDLSDWIAAGLSVKPVSINAAPAEFLRDDYAERLLERIDRANIPHSLIEVEITEHVFLDRRAEHVVRALCMLNEAGVRIALDDFGTGYSSLSHLRDFPVDVLKIDRSFISQMLTDPAMEAIVLAIAQLGPSISMDIVAEGIEVPEQLGILRNVGCQFGQGYLFGKAMNAKELTQRLATGSWPFKRIKGA